MSEAAGAHAGTAILRQAGPWAAHSLFTNELVDQTVRAYLLFTSASCFADILSTRGRDQTLLLQVPLAQAAAFILPGLAHMRSCGLSLHCDPSHHVACQAFLTQDMSSGTARPAQDTCMAVAWQCEMCFGDKNDLHMVGTSGIGMPETLLLQGLGQKQGLGQLFRRMSKLAWGAPHDCGCLSACQFWATWA